MRVRKLMAVTVGALLCSAAFIPSQASAAESAVDHGVARAGHSATIDAGWEHSCSTETPSVCVYVQNNGHGWSAFGTFPYGQTYGHLDVFGPDHVTHHSGADRPWSPGDASPTFTGTGVGNVCTQGWYRRPDGTYESQGLACLYFG